MASHRNHTVSSTAKKKPGHMATMFVAVIYLSCALLLSPKVMAIDRVKSTDTFVGHFMTPITNTTTDTTFTVYIGDNLAGVSDPVKSAYFQVSGVYTGGSATLDFQINSDAATLQQFTLPNVSVPTPFMLIYQDSTGKISPTTAGLYQYTLNITVPAGITVYGLGTSIKTTYRHTSTACEDGQPDDEKIKTVKAFVGHSPAAISSQVDKDFSLYIGDNISDVSNPLQSVFFKISGVYSGGGTMNFKINANGSTSQTVTLPSVSSPTPFEILYQDPSNIISPASAGLYTYQLNITPSGVTVYGFGAIATVSYRYKPPCGNSLPATGEITSAVFDTTGSADGAAYNSVFWKGTLNAGVGKVRFQLATSDSSSGPWSFIGGATCSGSDWYTLTSPNIPVEITCAAGNHNNHRYFRYKVQLCSASDCSSAGTISPIVQDVILNWSP